VPTPGAPLSPCLAPGGGEELGQGAEGRVRRAGCPPLPRAGLGCWESGRGAAEHCLGRDG